MSDDADDVTDTLGEEMVQAQEMGAIEGLRTSLDGLRNSVGMSIVRAAAIDLAFVVVGAAIVIASLPRYGFGVAAIGGLVIAGLGAFGLVEKALSFGGGFA